MTKTSCLIAAAGKGSRSGLPYPKTLYPIEGKPILIHILEKFKDLDSNPTVIVSPKGMLDIKNCLDEWNKEAYLVIQDKPLGMGNAVLQFEKSPAYENTDDVILTWGDIPYLDSQTIKTMVSRHSHKKNTFTFPTRDVDLAYTIVKRNEVGHVEEVIETREHGLEPMPGEREIGLFEFKKSAIMNLLKKDYKERYGFKTLEHGFLYVVKLLVKNNLSVEALKIAGSRELISLNKLTDLDIL